MPKRAKDGMLLEELITLAIPTCQQAEQLHPRTGPGAKPKIPNWVLAVMILVGVLLRKKTKTDQYQFWLTHQALFIRCFPRQHFPGRSTFFERYSRVHPLVQTAIGLQGEQAIARGWADPRCVAVDKSLIRGRGRKCNSSQRRRGRVPRGVDPDTTWSYSTHNGWIQGYSYEAVVTAPQRGVTWPLLASVDTASRSEHKSFALQIPQLHPHVQTVTADAGYDSNALGEAIEWQGLPDLEARPRRTGRRFLCPQISRPQVGKPRKPSSRESRQRQRHRRLRAERLSYFQSTPGQRLYARRKVRSEPFNSHLKTLFELDDRVWHWGLENNRAAILCAIFTYQILLTYNHLHGRANSRLKWLLHRL